MKHMPDGYPCSYCGSETHTVKTCLRYRRDYPRVAARAVLDAKGTEPG